MRVEEEEEEEEKKKEKVKGEERDMVGGTLSLYLPFSLSLPFSLPQPAPTCIDGAKVPHMMLNPTPSITSAEFEQKWLALPVR